MSEFRSHRSGETNLSHCYWLSPLFARSKKYGKLFANDSHISSGIRGATSYSFHLSMSEQDNTFEGGISIVIIISVTLMI